MGNTLSVAAAAVPWALTLLGVPLPAVTGGLSTVNAVVSALPKDRKKLKKLVQEAAKDFGDQCAHESRELGDTDRAAVVERLVKLFDTGDQRRLLAAALIGEPEFQAALLIDETYAELSDDEQGFLIALVVQVHGLVLRFAQSPEVIGVASTGALRVISAQLMLRPTFDQVLQMVLRVVAGELRLRQLVVGARPRLASRFVAREEVQHLREILADGGVSTVCALQGMRGVGKSQLASAVAEECENAGWRFVGWVTAPTRDQAVGELAEIARLAGVSVDDDSNLAARALVTWLSSSGPDDRLLVLDNVTDVDHVKDLIPHGPGMRVLVTTTSRTSAVGIPILVEGFSEGQAVEYLESATGQGDREGARLVAEDLGRLPVALAQAAVGMNLWAYSYSRYRELLSEHPLDEVMHQDDGDSYPSKVGIALRIAYTGVLKHLHATAPSVGEAARAMLGALSLMAESGVPRGWLDPLADDELATRKAVGELVRRSVLIESADHTTISLHRLQSQIIREAETAHDGLHDCLRAAVAVLAGVDLEAPVDNLQARTTCSQLGSQLSAIHKQAHSRALVEDPDLLAIVSMLAVRSTELWDRHVPRTLAYYLDTMERVLGSDHRHTGAFRHVLAGAYLEVGDLRRAIPLFQQTLAGRERVLGADHPDTLLSRHSLAGAYQLAGDLRRAITLYERTLADRERVLGPNDPQTLTTRNNLAGACHSAGDLCRAITLYERTLVDRERVLGPDDPKTLATRNNLAGTYQSAGDLRRAISLFERTLADTLERLGTDHPQTLSTRNNLAGAYQSAGELDRAVPLYERALADAVRILPPDDVDTLTIRTNLAHAYRRQGRQGDALKAFEEAACSAERLLGPAHHVTRNISATRDAVLRATANSKL